VLSEETPATGLEASLAWLVAPGPCATGRTGRPGPGSRSAPNATNFSARKGSVTPLFPAGLPQAHGFADRRLKGLTFPVPAHRPGVISRVSPAPIRPVSAQPPCGAGVGSV